MRISDWSSDVCSSDLPLQSLGSPGQDVGCDHFRVDHETRAGDVAPCDLLDDDDIVEPVSAKAAIFGRHAGAEHAEIGSLGPHFTRHDSLLLPLTVLRHEFLLDDPPHRFAARKSTP